jgi:hypothetical protein
MRACGHLCHLTLTGLPWVRCQAAPAISIGDTLVTVGGKNVYGLSLTTLRLLSIHESLHCELCMSAYRAVIDKNGTGWQCTGPSFPAPLVPP